MSLYWYNKWTHNQSGSETAYLPYRIIPVNKCRRTEGNRNHHEKTTQIVASSKVKTLRRSKTIAWLQSVYPKLLPNYLLVLTYSIKFSTFLPPGNKAELPSFKGRENYNVIIKSPGRYRLSQVTNVDCTGDKSWWYHVLFDMMRWYKHMTSMVFFSNS